MKAPGGTCSGDGSAVKERTTRPLTISWLDAERISTQKRETASCAEAGWSEERRMFNGATRRESKDVCRAPTGVVEERVIFSPTDRAVKMAKQDLKKKLFPQTKVE